VRASDTDNRSSHWRHCCAHNASPCCSPRRPGSIAGLSTSLNSNVTIQAGSFRTLMIPTRGKPDHGRAGSGRGLRDSKGWGRTGLGGPEIIVMPGRPSARCSAPNSARHRWCWHVRRHWQPRLPEPTYSSPRWDGVQKKGSAALAWISLSASIMITLCRGQPPGSAAGVRTRCRITRSRPQPASVWAGRRTRARRADGRSG